MWIQFKNFTILCDLPIHSHQLIIKSNIKSIFSPRKRKSGFDLFYGGLTFRRYSHIKSPPFFSKHILCRWIQKVYCAKNKSIYLLMVYLWHSDLLKKHYLFQLKFQSVKENTQTLCKVYIIILKYFPTDEKQTNMSKSFIVKKGRINLRLAKYVMWIFIPSQALFLCWFLCVDVR